jgi:hypothetical protein
MRSSLKAARSALLILFVAAASVLAALPGSFAAPSKQHSSGKLIRADVAPPAKSVELRTEAPSSADASRLKIAGVGFEPFALFQVSFADSISSFGGDCTTPKTSWSLGETVCVRVSGPLDASRVLRHVQLVNPDGFVIDSLDLTTSPQTMTFTLPSARSVNLFGLTLDNRGTWRVNVTDTSDASVRAFAPITVHDNDPTKIVADLQISKFLTGNATATAGSNIQSVIWVFNGGPDAAQNVRFTDLPPANTTFQSLTQTDGPLFNCTTPAVDTSGTTLCTKSSMAKDEAAGFIITYKVNAAIGNGTELASSVSVASDTTERSAANNSSDETVNASNPSPPNCTISCPANITQDSDPGQAGAIVNYTAPTTAGTCGDVTTDHPSGSFFPIGTTPVTTTVADGSATGVSCTFSVTVVDKRTVAVNLVGSADMTVECRTGFTDPGATATTGATLTSAITVPTGQVDSNGDPTYSTVTAVDPNSPNTYTITYTATLDTNSSTATRTVHVVDTTPPVITLAGTTGLTPQTAQVTVTNDDGTTSIVTETIFVGTVECHTSFTPPTASATDGCDDHAVTVTTTGTVDVNTPGVYEIVYAATDAAGNDTDSRVRVTVVDTTPPVITLTGANPATVECHATFNDPGATATDGCAGSVPVTATGTVNTAVPGAYTITYTATDPSGNAATAVTRTVNVVDTTPPVITLNGSASMTVECHNPFNDPLASATDECDPTPTVTSSGGVDTSTPATYIVTYTATDHSGNAASVQRTVIVRDTTPPTLTLNGASSVTVECHVPFNDPRATATDGCAGDLSAAVVRSGSLDVNTPGTYTLSYAVSDPSGNAAVPVSRTVVVRDTTPPTLTLNGASTMTVECHTSYTDPGASATDACDSSVPVGVSGAVNVNTPATYTVTYTATDDSGNTSTATRTVTVVDSTKPVITVVGANPYTVILGSSFTDPGATAADSCAGSVPVTATGTVNTSAVGTYTITYNATDPSGNAAVAATRTVNVIYNFTGFFSPVSNLPTLNQVNAGRAIPVKFSLAGNQGLGIMAAGYPASQQVSCSTSAPISDVQETTTAGNSSLSYDGAQYNYVWKTESVWAGTCRVLTVKLIDGTSHTANFKFK